MTPLVPFLMAASLLGGSASADDALATGAKKASANKFDRSKSGQSAGVQGKPLDLSGLLGGPKIQGPSMDAAPAGPEKDILLAAVAEFAQNNRAVAFDSFGKIFTTGPGGIAFTQDHISAAAKVLTGMINSGKIKVGRAQGAAGAWSPDLEKDASNPDQYNMTGGTFEIGDPAEIKKIGRAPTNFSQVFKQDQFANTILHETAHMFYSAIRSGMHFQDPSQNPIPEEFGSRYFWNGAGVATMCPGGTCPSTMTKKAPFCKQDELSCYSWKISNHSYGKEGTGTEWAARVISQGMCNVGQCEAYARVLAPVLQ